MRPLKRQPEPACFDARVRKRGLAYMKANPRIPVAKWPAYWRDISCELWEAYEGIDAYYSYFFEYMTGVQVDHFLPKSIYPQLAYEWSNYRLTCSGSNGHKHAAMNILDPFTMRPNSFHINFLNGEISPNASYDKTYVSLCKRTIKVLRLDDNFFNEMRRRRFYEFCIGLVSLDHLKKVSPFVWDEICRQGLQRLSATHSSQLTFKEFVAMVLPGIL